MEEKLHVVANGEGVVLEEANNNSDGNQEKGVWYICLMIQEFQYFPCIDKTRKRKRSDTQTSIKWNKKKKAEIDSLNRCCKSLHAGKN